jgi:hypothetical protein
MHKTLLDKYLQITFNMPKPASRISRREKKLICSGGTFSLSKNFYVQCACRDLVAGALGVKEAGLFENLASQKARHERRLK